MRGSRRIDTPLETASIPVYVPPPIEYARRISNISGSQPREFAEARKSRAAPWKICGMTVNFVPIA